MLPYPKRAARAILEAAANTLSSLVCPTRMLSSGSPDSRPHGA